METTRLSTRAERTANGYRITGQKIWTSRAEHSDLMILLARTRPLTEVTRTADGLSVFLIDLREAADVLTIRPIRTMMNHSTTEMFFDGLEVGEDSVVGEEGRGFSYILDGMNAERIPSRPSASATGAGSRRRPRATPRNERCSVGRSAPIRGCSFPSPAPMPRSRRPA